MPEPDAIVVEGGDVYAPEPLGIAPLLVMNGRIRQVGPVDVMRLEQAGLETERLDATGCLIVPGLIDVHEHLIGGSGEGGGFSTQTPEVGLRELLQAGITTVVGCLGTDTVTRNMPALLAKVKSLREEGVTAFLYSGGYTVPPATLTGSVHQDILLVNEVIGAGEVAVSDWRSSAPSLAELARVVRQASTAGMLARKAGVTHFHMGEEKAGLQPLRDLIEQFECAAATLYPTHVERNDQLFREAVDLTRHGSTVDVDTVEEDLPKWFGRYGELDGDPAKLTASSDAAIMSPGTLLAQLLNCCRSGHPVERVFMLTSTNPAAVLKLANKGRLRPGYDADVAAIDRASGTVRHLLARGQVMVRDGIVKGETFLAKSNRRIELYGQKN